ncbi:MAG: hypothetical protein P1V51_17475 [Deltaproteobacteria bacterium]|nr:hypothetical protein [Deltaproteobacteria bacterium]
MGDPGIGCTATDNGDGTYDINCDGNVVTVSDGQVGQQGGSCTVVDNLDGTKTITCDDGTTAVVQDGTVLDPADVDVEACATCHKGAGARHQAVYADYLDSKGGNLELTLDSVTSVANGANWDNTLTFTVTLNGLPYVDAAGLPGLGQKRFMGLEYTGGQYVNPISFGTIAPTATPGQYTAVSLNKTYAIDASNAAVYGYVGTERLDDAAGGHVGLYADVASAALTFGTWATDTVGNTKAKVSGCEKCHGAPYMKHGYRDAVVTGLEDFDSCRFCHYDNRAGGHEDWQVLVDDPLRFTQLDTTPLTAAEEAKYAYTANVMNDTHMAHAMEFPYPASMANCATCHEGFLTDITSPANFNITTCKSCHPVTGSAQYGTADLALETLMSNTAAHREPYATACPTCHTGGALTPTFAEIHSGYNQIIYQAPDVKWAEMFVTTVDTVSYNATTNVLSIAISATEDAASTSSLGVADITPTIMVGLYGWETKDFIVGPHERDSSRNRLLEFVIDGVETNPRLTVTDDGSTGDGTWAIDVDLSMWATELTDGTVLRAEVGVMPALIQPVGEKDLNLGTCTASCSRGEYCSGTTNTCTPEDDVVLGTDAVSRTFDFAANAFDDGHFEPIVDVAKCNSCHDQLATTFHSADRGGSVVVCRMCHITKSGGSHLEMQSRSIDSYAHAIHNFQAFDSGDVDFTDPVEKMRYELHIEHTIPTFTAKGCEACHNPGTYDVPDQAKSMGGLLSGSDTWNVDRAIGDVPSVIVGPGARACGGCHRAELINEDDANGLLALNQHFASNGYRVEDTSLLEQIAAVIASFFE